ncbi:hypothetical protein PABG_05059 [Paracoccidioides brasiliensis Pb03]|nr:hypothetical protein PABG_05059 [Paracoccidioides brasiliensis Pb03]
MATLIPIPSTTPTPDTQQQQQQLQPNSQGGWYSWTPEEQGGILAASILVFLFLFALTLFVSLHAPKRVHLPPDEERAMGEPGQRRRTGKGGRFGRRSAGISQPATQLQQNQSILSQAVKDSRSHETTKNGRISDYQGRVVPDALRIARRESMTRSHRESGPKLRTAQRSRSCQCRRDFGLLEGGTGPRGQQPRQTGGIGHRNSMDACDGSDETFERGLDSIYIDDNNPGPSTLKGKEKAKFHRRQQSDWCAREGKPRRHKRSYSLN